MADLTGPEGIRAATVAQPDIVGGIKTGMDFAQRRVQNDFQREELKLRQDQFQLQKDEFNSTLLKSSLDIIKSIEGRPPKAQQKLLDMFQKNMKRAGFDLGGIAREDLLAKDPTVRTALDSIAQKIQAGGLQPKDLSGMLTKLAQLASNDDGKDFGPTILRLEKEIQRQQDQQQKIGEIEATSAAAGERQAQAFQMEVKDRPTKLAQETEKEKELIKARGESAKELKALDVAAEAAQKKAEADAKKELENMKLTADTRKELAGDQVFKDYFQTRSAGRAALDAIDRKDPFGDLSVLFNAIKVLDPGSVVRESESGKFTGTGALGTRMAAWLTAKAAGRTIPDSERRNLKIMLMGSWKERAQSYVDRRASSLEQVSEAGGRLEHTDPGRSALAQDVAFWNKHKLLPKGEERTGGLLLTPQETGAARKQTLEEGGKVEKTALTPEQKKQSALIVKKRAQLNDLEALATTPEQKQAVRNLKNQLDRMGQ